MKKIAKFILPFGMGLSLIMISVMGFVTTSLFGCLDACVATEQEVSDKCCTTSGGIQVMMVTITDECDCPSNTTFIGLDTQYGVKKCDCNAC